MAKVNKIAKAQKDYPRFGIKKGDTYYSWKLGRNFPEQKSLTYPKRSQLTTSDKLAQCYEAIDGLQDNVSKLDADTVTEAAELLRSFVEDAVSELQEAADGYRESADNIREHFSDSSTADECEEKADSIENTIGELEGLDLDADDEDLPAEDDKRKEAIAQRIQDMVDEVLAIDVEV